MWDSCNVCESLHTSNIPVEEEEDGQNDAQGRGANRKKKVWESQSLKMGRGGDVLFWKWLFL